MPQPDPPRNRGPAAAGANRAALVEAARSLFAREGYAVPLSAIARAAGVGQGVLYRHFGSRVSLALAVFGENIDELEALAGRHTDPDGLGVLVARMLEQTLANAALVDAVVHGRVEQDWDGDERVGAVLVRPLARARSAGLVRPDLTVADLLLLVRCAHGLIGTQQRPGAARAGVLRLARLVDAPLGDAVAAQWGCGDGPDRSDS
ncbi:TetR/AcrR family transcriptional regulator [Propioniciclava soli]|uniref:TetR/AcrR family transcriptional regulator n=1 Tax=Propioniciclava soli TaxID=2775081 RepID=UPI001E4858AF|nr:TetR/AcrR family transcriptional regulator [Propioniciclava soli]